MSVVNIDERRPIALVAVGDPQLADAVALELHSHGHRVVVGEVGGPGLSLPGPPASVLVADAATFGDLCALTPIPGRVVVVHEEADVAGMWTSYRLGASPCVVRRDKHVRVTLPLALEPAPLGGGEVALEALHHEIVGRHADACEALAHVRPDEVADAVEALVEAGAAALDRLRRRARYPVPTSLLVDQLPAHLGTLDEDAFARWWEMVQVVAFRASALQPPVTPTIPGDHQGRLFGAFHAASAIVQFTARRHWRRPVELLGDLAGSPR